MSDAQTKHPLNFHLSIFFSQVRPCILSPHTNYYYAIHKLLTVETSINILIEDIRTPIQKLKLKFDFNYVIVIPYYLYFFFM